MRTVLSPFLAIVLLLSLSPAASAANVREDDLINAMRAAIKAIRIPYEASENTSRTYASLPIPLVKSFQFPTSWATRLIYQDQLPQVYRLSTAMHTYMNDKMAYKPERLKDGTYTYGMPLDMFFGKAVLPLLSDDPKVRDLRVIRIQKPVSGDMPDSTESHGFVQLCSYSWWKQTRTGAIPSAASGAIGLAYDLEHAVTLQTTPQFLGDAYLPNVRSYSITGTSLMGLPAAKLELTVEASWFRTVPQSIQYVGVYAATDNTVLCAEVAAAEDRFPEYKKAFDLVTSSMQRAVTTEASSASVSSSSSSRKRIPAVCKTQRGKMLKRCRS